jgi:AcrR family transcriptional regulator
MTSASFQRARRPEQKRQRREAILAAAAALLAEEGFDGVSLSAISRRVGLAKSNVYRYFEGREQIFLTILMDDMRGWANEVQHGLASVAGRNSVAAAAGVIASGFVGRQRLCELNSVRSTVLEPNVSEQTVVNFRSGLGEGVAKVADALHRALPSIPPDRCRWAVGSVFALVGGMWPLSRISPELESAPSRSELRHLRPDFAEDLSTAARALLYGLLVESWRASGRPTKGV